MQLRTEILPAAVLFGQLFIVSPFILRVIANSREIQELAHDGDAFSNPTWLTLRLLRLHIYKPTSFVCVRARAS